ncbi:GntR family transcriptional regulator [Tistrella bauzanensis]|uniref:GntR family transcriptional regulator n=1 Tax=Tistrella TaxID=171436 RepID=UPI0031F6B242
MPLTQPTDTPEPPGQPGGVRRSLADTLARRIADDIIEGRLPPGIRLDEAELAGRFAVSRTPVREALGQVCAMGLAGRRPHRGVVVTVMSEARLHEMFVAMAELEASAARLAALNMTGTERHQLETLHLDSAAAVRAGAVEDYAAWNTRFHMLIYAGSHNAYLEELVGLTRKRLAPFRRAQFNVLGRLASSCAEHDRMVQAILRADAEAAAEATRAHVLTVSAASVAYVGARGADADRAPQHNPTASYTVDITPPGTMPIKDSIR